VLEEAQVSTRGGVQDLLAGLAMEYQIEKDELDRSLRLLQSALARKPKMSKFEFWFRKSWTGIVQAFVVDIIWPMRIWYALCLFPLLRPIHSWNYFERKFLVNISEREVTEEDAHKFLHALVIFTVYGCTLVTVRILGILFRGIRYVFMLVWDHPVPVWMMGESIRILMFLVPTYPSLVLKGHFLCVKAYHHLVIWGASAVRWTTNFYFKSRVWITFWWTWLSESVCIRIFEDCLRQGLSLFLRRLPADRLISFGYSPLKLGEKQIRLLRLDRRIPFLDLKMELITYDFDKAPPYEAISYVWGDSKHRENSVILNDQRYCVTINVFNILRRRSSLFKSKLIWIDTICIDQSNDAEKSEQVRMMKEIYHQSDRVYICLGENPDAWLAIKMLNDLVILKQLASKATLSRHLFHFYAGRSKGDKYLDAQLTALLDLLHHPWFNRIWVVQEVVAARSIRIIYGSYVIPWESLMILVKLFVDPETQEIMSIFQYSGDVWVARPVPLGPTHASFMNGFRDLFRRKQTIHLYEALRTFLAFKSSVPRDKIFALLGLTDASKELRPLVRYEKDATPALLLGVANYILEQGNLFQILHFAGIGWDHSLRSLPSWVVNWTESLEPTTLAHSWYDSHLQYRAGTGRMARIFWNPVFNTIKLGVIKLGRIDALLDSLMISSDPNQLVDVIEGTPNVMAWTQEARAFARKYVADPYPTTPPQPLSEVLWRTLIGDRTASSRPAPPHYGQQFERLDEICKAFQKEVEEHGTDFSNYLKNGGGVSLLGTFPNFDVLRDFMRDMYNKGSLFGSEYFPRKLCVLGNGYLGVVPKNAKVGDVVCVVLGAQVPFVFRRVKRGETGEKGESGEGGEISYRLVGECYVHGMMDGEAFELNCKAKDLEII
jgi:hypothetical protein